MSEAWLRMTASALGRAIGAGEIDPVELTEMHLDAIAAHPLRDRIFARPTPERARAEAEAAAVRARAGQRRGPLDGVPISWKDLFDTAGVATEAGSALLAGRVPDRDARVLADATRAGLVCLGKTHMTELAFSGLGYNPVTATPPCVNDPAAVPGGSSSGAAASVAFGLARAAVGSDTGGSVRMPAVWNDLVGLKTTAGRLSLDGVVPMAARFDTVGPLTRSVEDAAAMFAALGGGRAPDLAGASLAGVRLMLPEGVALEGLEDAPQRAFDLARERLTAAGAELVPRPAPEAEAVQALSATLLATEAYGTWRDVIEADPDAMYGAIRDRFRSGAETTGPDFVAGWLRLEELRADWQARTAAFDAVLLPTCPILPPETARLAEDAAYYRDRNLATLRNTRIANMLGLSALTLPTPVPSAGVTLMGPPGAEARLLRLGAAAEAALA